MFKLLKAAAVALPLLLGVEESGQAAGQFAATSGPTTLATDPTTICSLTNTASASGLKLQPSWISFTLSGAGSTQNVTVGLYLRSTLDTGGTPSAATVTPYSGTPTPVGALQTYTANPSARGTGGITKGIRIITGGYGATGTVFGMIWQFGTGRDGSPLPLPLLPPGYELAIDLSGVAQATTAAVTCDAEWQEK
jgi:hypothetical protein